MNEELNSYKLTQFSKAAGCGCKIAPAVLEEILKNNKTNASQALLVGNNTNDDAAVYQLNENEALISTTDFFAPIVNNAFVFGKAAAANAISDVYAMGGNPFLALAILGWPIDKLPTALAQQVIAGAKEICNQHNIVLAGGHTIDLTEPIFGLSVNGLVANHNIKQNSTANVGDVLLLTKPLGVGILATAEKRELITEEDKQNLYRQLTQVNNIGEKLATLPDVTAITDVTGFGLLGHLIEMTQTNNTTVELHYASLPIIPNFSFYLEKNIVPDATYRNWNSYSKDVEFEKGLNVMEAFKLLPDPQTNGGLLIAVKPTALAAVQNILKENGYHNFINPIGKFIPAAHKKIMVKY